MANNPLSFLQTAQKTIGNFSPLDALLHLTPGLGNVEQAAGYKPPTINDIIGNLNNQGSVTQKGTDALAKVLRGQSLNPQEKQDQLAFLRQSTNQAIGSVGDEGGTSTEDAVAQANKILAKKPTTITLKPSVYGAGREAAVQKTVDTIVPGANATQKYNNLQPTMDNLGKQIQNIMTQNPKVTSLSDVMGNFEKNLQDQGVYRTAGGSRNAVQKVARSYISDLNNEATQGNQILNPSTISDMSLQKIKQQVNQDAQSIYKKIDNGTSLTDKDKVILAARQTLDDTISQLHPEMKNLTVQQSHLYDAADSLFKGREAESASVANQPGTLDKILNMTIKNPAFDTLAALTGVHSLGGAINQTGALAGVGASKLMDYINKINNPSNSQNISPGQSPQNNNNGLQINHGGSISNDNNNVNRYALQNDPIKTGQIMQTSDYASQKVALQKKIGEETVTNPIQAAQDQGSLNALDTKWNSQSGLRTAWIDPDKGIGNVLTVGNTAYDSINKADPGFFNALNQGYDKLQTASNGKYAQMSKYLQYVGNATGTDFTQYKTKDALIGALDASMNTTKDRWNTLQQQYNSPQQKLMNIITPQPAQQPVQYPRGGFGSTGDLNTGSDLLNKMLQQATQ